MGNGTATGLFGEYSLLSEKAFEPEPALKIVRFAGDERSLPIF
jgi:hypothetical protein